MKNKKVILGAAFLAATVFIAGCGKKELTKEEVKNSEYYKQLQVQLKESKETVDELKEQLAIANEKTPKEKELDSLIEKLSRDSFIKFEISNEKETVFVEEKGVYSLANDMALSAAQITRYSVDDIKLNYGKAYQYVLYDEDNSIFEIEVYHGDFIVFEDYPDMVFYSPGAGAIGDAYIKQSDSMPAYNPFQIMTLSQLVTENNKCYFGNKAKALGQAIFSMSKKRVKEESIEENDKKVKKQYIFHYYGKTVNCNLYSSYIEIINDNKNIWYQVSNEDIKGIYTLLKEDS